MKLKSVWQRWADVFVLIPCVYISDSFICYCCWCFPTARVYYIVLSDYCVFVCLFAVFLLFFFFVSSYSCILHLYSILLLVGFHLTFRVRSIQCKYIQIHFVWLKNGNPIIIINYCVDHKKYELARLGAWCTFELCACQANRAKNRAKYRANQSTVSQQQHSADWMNGPNNIEQWNRISCYYWKSKQRCHLTNNNNTRWEDDDNEK